MAVFVAQQLAGAFGFVVFAAMLVAGCGSDGDATATPTAPTTPTASATASATPGTTPGTTATPPASVTPPVTVPSSITYEDAFPQLPDLDRPIAMVEAPGGILLVALQDGRIVSFPKDDDPGETTVVHDQRDRTSRGGNEEGLLGMALDPAFDANGYLYLYYSAASGARHSVLSRFETTGAGADLRVDAGSELELLSVPQPYSNHNGGQLAFGPDGMLYLALGDGGSGGDPQGNGQDLTRNLLGAILRLDVRQASEAEPYRIPADNPFAGDATANGETWAYGLRNPWRFSFDRETGDLWAGDVGQGEIEEIDLIQRGGNYGWSIMEGSSCYDASSCDRQGLVLPVAEYDHSGGNCSVTGGFVYRGSAVPALRGAYVYADFCSGATWGFDASAAAAGEAVEPVRFDESGPPVSSFAQDADGELYLLAFDGRIYRITGAS